MLKRGVFLIILTCCPLSICDSSPNTPPVSSPAIASANIPPATPAITPANSQPAHPQISPTAKAPQKDFWSKDGTGNKLTFWGLILTAIGILVGMYIKKTSGNSTIVKIGDNNSGQTTGNIDSKGGPITVNQGD